LFVLIESDIKIFALLDGHGEKGNQVSSFAAAKMISFFQSDMYRNIDLKKESDAKIKKLVQKCFKYV